MGGAAEDEIHEEHAYLRGPARFTDMGAARCRIDHRMRTCQRELVGAEIEDAVDVSGMAADIRRDGSEQRLEDQPSLVGEGAAGEESEHPRSSRAPPAQRQGGRTAAGCVNERGPHDSPPASAAARAAASSSVVTQCPGAPARGAAPRQDTTTGLSIVSMRASTSAMTGAAGGFEISTMTRVAGSAASSRSANFVIAPPTGG